MNNFHSFIVFSKARERQQRYLLMKSRCLYSSHAKKEDSHESLFTLVQRDGSNCTSTPALGHFITKVTSSQGSFVQYHAPARLVVNKKLLLSTRHTLIGEQSKEQLQSLVL